MSIISEPINHSWFIAQTYVEQNCIHCNCDQIFQCINNQGKFLVDASTDELHANLILQPESSEATPGW